MRDTTFIYALCEPRTRIVRYIGKADQPVKRLKQHLRVSSKKKTYLGHWLSSLILQGEVPGLIVLREVLFSEWSIEEKRYLSAARVLGMNLVNATDGGEGGSLSEESQAKRIKTITGRKLSKEHAKKCGDYHRGRKRSEETRNAISRALTGRTFSEEHKKNLGLSHRGVSLSKEHREALGRARKGIKFSDEHRKNMSLAGKGKRFSEAHCLALSQVRKGKPWSESRRAAFENSRRVK